MSAPEWIPALAVDTLDEGESRVVAHGRERIALFRLEEETFYAIDNRCPHEGYPLARGSVRDCVVTCPWHNFKFDLRDGHCVLGDEQVRVYPIRVREGTVEIDVRAPDPAQLIPHHRRSLEGAVQGGKLGQIAREAVRLLELGVTPSQLALTALRLDATFAEYGTTHATPVAIDGIFLARRYAGPQAALPLVPAFFSAAESNLRLPERARAEPIDPGDDPVAAWERLREYVETEALGDAEALLRGALARGWGQEIVEPWVLRLCAEHLLGFGHPLIYATKLFPFLRDAGWEHADELLPALLARTINSTRTDQIPEERWLREQIAQAKPKLATWSALCGRDDAPAIDRPALVAALLDGTRDGWMEQLSGALEAGVDLDSVADALVLAASERLLRFDAGIDANPAIQEGWLDVTHRFTFASAVRDALRNPCMAGDPALPMLLLQAAFFIHAAAPLDRAEERRIPRATESSIDVSADLERMKAAIRRQAGAEAVQAAEQVLLAHEAESKTQLAEGSVLDRLESTLESLALGDLATRPIHVAHWIKLCVAAFAEARALPSTSDRRAPILACVRYFAGPAQENRSQSMVHDAIRFVVEGKVPKTLT